MHHPHRLKRNESGEKSVSILVKTFFFFGDHLNLGEKNVWISDFGRKITLNFGEDLFFWRPPEFGRKKTFEFPISAEKSLSILVKTSEFLRFCASNPPQPKFSRSATAYIVYLKCIFPCLAKTSKCGKFWSMLYWNRGFNYFFLKD